MTDADRRKRLINWLETIYADLQRLLLNDHLFWEFQEIVEQNDEFLKASGLFTQFIAAAYTQSAAVGVRRHAKSDKDSVSIVRFLREVRDHPQIVSREHYIGLYEGKESWHIEIGQHHFDRVAGKGSLHLPPELADQQIQEVKRAVEKIEHYVDRRVAHYDKRELARPVPKFSELTDALKALERIVILYWPLLKGPSMTTIVPTILYDWKDIFRFAWIPKLRRQDELP
jgi:hypothetical protein